MCSTTLISLLVLFFAEWTEKISPSLKNGILVVLIALAGKFAQYCIQFSGYRWHLQRHTMSELLTLLGNAASQWKNVNVVIQSASDYLRISMHLIQRMFHLLLTIFMICRSLVTSTDEHITVSALMKRRYAYSKVWLTNRHTLKYPFILCRSLISTYYCQIIFWLV